MSDHTVPTNGTPLPPPQSMLSRPWTAEEQARVEAIPLPPNQWVPGDLAVGVWDPETNGYRSWVADPETGEPLRPLSDEPQTYEPPPPAVVTSLGSPGITIRRLGPVAWVVDTGLAEFTFRNVATHRDLSADITVMAGSLRIIRTTTSMSVTSRNTFTKACVQRAPGYGNAELWARAIDLAFEAVLDEQEKAGDATLIRGATTPLMGQSFVVDPIWPTGPALLVAPGEIGKSTLARAMSVSIATGVTIVPGLVPRVTGPVLYVASEDPGAEPHIRSVEAICRGAGIERREMAHDMLLLPSNGRSLHHIAQRISEMAADFAGVVLDAQQGLMPAGDAVRDVTAIFWNAIDQIGRPVFVVSHPNKMNSQQWADSDGRAAGSEVTRDRARMTWMLQMKPEPAVAGTYHSLMVLRNTKNNDGPRYEQPIAFRRTWTPGEVTFTPAAVPVGLTKPKTPLTVEMRDTVRAWDEGARTMGQVAKALGITPDAAKKRLQSAKAAGHIIDEHDQ